MSHQHNRAQEFDCPLVSVDAVVDTLSSITSMIAERLLAIPPTAATLLVVENDPGVIQPQLEAVVQVSLTELIEGTLNWSERGAGVAANASPEWHSQTITGRHHDCSGQRYRTSERKNASAHGRARLREKDLKKMIVGSPAFHSHC